MYKRHLEYVKQYLIENNGNVPEGNNHTFRSRYAHCERVFMWTKRLIEDIEDIDREALLIAAIFHDIGYGYELKVNHAENGAEIFKQYAIDNNIDNKLNEFIYYLIFNHSNKKMLTDKNTPLELIILMEADWLDEEGAMKIVWDCMAEARIKGNSYEDAYYHIKEYYGSRNPMITEKARMYWDEKQKLIDEFIKHLEFDLGIQKI